MNKPWLTCERFAHLAARRIDGQITCAQRLSMWLHLRICGPCGAHLDQLATTAALLHELKPEQPAPCPDDTRAALLDAFRASQRR